MREGHSLHGPPTLVCLGPSLANERVAKLFPAMATDSAVLFNLDMDVLASRQ